MTHTKTIPTITESKSLQFVSKDEYGLETYYFVREKSGLIEVFEFSGEEFDGRFWVSKMVNKETGKDVRKDFRSNFQNRIDKITGHGTI